MEFKCPECNQSHDVDESHIPASGMAIQCVDCGHRFRISIEEHPETESDEYFIKDNGEIRGPYDLNEFRMLIETSQIDQNIRVSRDKQDWKDVSEIEALTSLEWPDDDQLEWEDQQQDLTGATQIESDFEEAIPDDEDQKQTEPPAEDDDLFEQGGGGDDLFSESVEEDDLFGEPEKAGEHTADVELDSEENLEEDEDLLEFDDEDDDDLFETSTGDDEEDLFEETEALQQDDDYDELFEEGESFAFLEDEDDRDTSGIRTEDLELDKDSGEGDSTDITADIETDEDEDDPSRIQQPASTGIPEPPPGHQKRAERKDESEKISTRTAILVGVLICLVGGAGFYYYQKMASSSSSSSIDPSKIVQVDFRKIRSDNFSDYTSAIKYARSQKKLSAKAKAKLAVVEALFLLQYRDSKIRSHLDSLVKEVRKLNQKKLENKALKSLGMGAYFAFKEKFGKAQTKLLPLTEKSRFIGYLSNLILGLTFIDKVRKPQSESSKTDKKVEQQRSRAIAFLESSANKNLATPAPHYQIGEVYWGTKDQSKAVKRYEKAISISNSHVRSRLRLLQHLVREGLYHKTKMHLSFLNNEYDKKLAKAEKGRLNYIVGKKRFASYRLDSAMKKMEKANKLDPKLSWLKELKDIYLEANEYQKGLDFIGGLQSKYELKQRAPIQIELLLQLKDWPAVEKRISNLKKKYSKSPVPHYYDALLALDRKKWSKVFDSLKKSIALDSDFYTSRIKLLELALDKNTKTPEDLDVESQLDVLKKNRDNLSAEQKSAVGYIYLDAFDDSEKGRAWFRDAIKTNGSYWNPKKGLAETFIAEEKFDQAIENLEGLKNQGFEHPTLFLTLANTHHRAGRLEKALKVVDEALEKTPHYEQLIMKRGDILFDMENFGKAESAYRRAYEENPSNTFAQYFVGRSLYKQGKSGKATNTFRSIIQKEPENRGEIYYWLGRSMVDTGSKSQALSAFEKATEYSTKIIGDRPDLLVQRGNIYADLGYLSKATKDFSRAKQKIPENPEIYTGLAEVYMSENKYQKAIDVLSKGLEYDSKSKILHFKLGNAYVNRNQSEKGVSHLQKALDLGYSDPKIYRMLGYLYRDLNQNDKAVESFKKYLAQADEEVLSASAKKKLITQIKRLGGSL